jgi:hypothetical protein
MTPPEPAMSQPAMSQPTASEPASFAAYDAPAQAPGFSQFVSNGTIAQTQQRSWTERNPTTFKTLLVVVGYLILAATTGIVLLGIFPAALSVRALRRGEPHGALAVVAAAVAVVAALSGV